MVPPGLGGGILPEDEKIGNEIILGSAASPLPDGF
jgi:hypothetical protein